MIIMEKGKIIYRNFNPSDLEAICKLPQDEQELYFMCPKADYPLTEEQLAEIIKGRFDSTVILYDHEIIGFANFYEVKKKEYCSIGNVIVSPHFRGCGIGTFLIAMMENTGKQKYEIQETRLSCFNANTAGILLYHKLGYIPFEIEKRTNKRNEISALIKLKKKMVYP